MNSWNKKKTPKACSIIWYWQYTDQFFTQNWTFNFLKNVMLMSYMYSTNKIFAKLHTKEQVSHALYLQQIKFSNNKQCFGQSINSAPNPRYYGSVKNLNNLTIHVSNNNSSFQFLRWYLFIALFRYEIDETVVNRAPLRQKKNKITFHEMFTAHMMILGWNCSRLMLLSHEGRGIIEKKSESWTIINDYHSGSWSRID